MKAALYLRVSTNQQDEENQLAPLQKLAEERIGTGYSDVEAQ
jgi:DNA invertase Pin-like site-specific DNA recombinase